MKSILKEAYAMTKKISGYDARNPNDFRNVMKDKTAYSVYTRALSEGLAGDDLETFNTLAANTRVSLLENSMFQLNPYETFTLPVLRNYYPKLVSKELVNVMPIDKPDVVKGFVHAYFKNSQGSAFDKTFPHVRTHGSYDYISNGAMLGVTVTRTASEGTTDILAVASLTSSTSHLEKNFRIVGVYDSTSNYTAVVITPSVDGLFSESITTSVSGVSDVVSGHVDWEAGTLTWSSSVGEVASVKYEAVCSLEENGINPTVRFEIEKIRLTAVDRRISAEWSVNMEQDVKALYDITLQSELINIIGEQIALDIDGEIISALINGNSSENGASHSVTFDKNPPVTYTWGRKAWYENILPTLNQLSAQIYNSCLMGAANTLACNPLDAAIFESLNDFEYTGNSVDGWDVGFRSATVQGGKWKILVSSVIPSGTIISKYRSNDLSRAAFVYAPYVPALLMPYPLGNNPSLTVMSRYATKLIRPEALGVMTVSDTA